MRRGWEEEIRPSALERFWQERTSKDVAKEIYEKIQSEREQKEGEEVGRGDKGRG